MDIWLFMKRTLKINDGSLLIYSFTYCNKCEGGCLSRAPLANTYSHKLDPFEV